MCSALSRRGGLFGSSERSRALRAASRGEEAALAVETTDSAGAARRASMSV